MLKKNAKSRDLHQCQFLVVSKDKRFSHRIKEMTRAFSFESYFRFLGRLPDIASLQNSIFYVLLIDVNERPENTLQWLSSVRAMGLDMPVIGVSQTPMCAHSLSIRRVYDVIAWQTLDFGALTKDKLNHAFELLLMEYGVDEFYNRPIQRDASEFALAFDAIEEVVLKLDRKLRVEYVNASAEKLLGVSSHALQGQCFFKMYDFFDDQTKTFLSPQLEKKLQGENPFKDDGPLLLLGKNVQIGYVGIACAPILVNEIEIAGYFIILRDLTEHHSLSAKLNYHSSHDQLSGLLSRMEFEARLQQAINDANDMTTDKPNQHVLMYLDIDQFRLINDACGHAVGDELILQFSVELSSIVRRGDTLARIGGDEFAIILWSCPEEKGLEIANYVRSRVEAFRFVWVNKVHKITVSIGVVALRQSVLSSWAEALRLVDTACDTAKELGRNRVELINPDDPRVQDRYSEMEWAHRLNAAFQGQGLLLFFQPIQSINEKIDKAASYRHFEVLVRYKDDNGKLVPPGVFLPPAERYSLIGILDRWVIRTTLEWIALQPFRDSIEICSINLSGVSMCDQHLPEYIKELFQSTGVNPGCICFEVTESVAVTNLTYASDFIRQLKDIGCRFALDDFGVGMSSFAYLKHMDVDFVKIDGSFVKNIVIDPIDKEMVRSINDIGHILGKKTVAEFCEDQECYDGLASLGVDYVQGYFIGRPSPVEAMTHFRPSAL